MEYNVDICIVGGSGAGLSAAIRATEAGANVLVLEKMGSTGGCTKMAGGIMGIGTHLQEEAGLHYSVEEMYKEVMAIYNWDCNSILVRDWYDHIGDNISWLEELGVEFSEILEVTGNRGKLRKTHHVTADSETGKNMWLALQKRCDELEVPILRETRAKHLIVEEGKVVGVEAENTEGVFRVHAKATILATGSISANDDLIKRFFGNDKYEKIRIMAKVPHNTGDGLVMAEEIGAQIGKLSTLYIGPHNHFPGASEAVGVVPRRPYAIKVNRNGKRFVDESLYTDSHSWYQSISIDRQPGKTCYAIIDSDILDMYKQNKVEMGYMERRFNRHDKYPFEWIDKLDEGFVHEQEAGRAKIANDFDEIAEWIGCDKDTLRNTIEEYNAACDAGHDSRFMKDPYYLMAIRKPPFYAVAGPSGVDTFIGGVQIDESFHVLNNDDDPIPGLYAAGVVASGWLGNFYGNPGSEMSFTLYSGQNAGKIAFEETK